MKIQDLIANPDYPQKIILQKLICHYLNISREDIRINSDNEISNSNLDKIITWYNSYINDSKPLDYIIWYVEFFWNKFIVNQNTIVPRPETEYMITAVTEYCNSLKQWNLPTGQAGTEALQHWNILIDVWTWSWVLWISVLLQNPSSFKTVFLTDYSQEALIVAKQNYDNLINTTQYDTRFIRSDLLSFVDSYTSIIQGKNIILLGNLPYIPEQTHDDNNPDSVKKREPRMAFVGGEDGLIYYYKMFDQILELIGKSWKEQGIEAKRNHTFNFDLSTLTCFLEMMTWQVDILRSKYSDYFIFEEVKTFHFNIRIVKVWFK